ncbi:unnamed protein product [Rhizophagus irregularis]|nr:unnamed protein product [Rhizophagus irregularis]
MSSLFRILSPSRASRVQTKKNEELPSSHVFKMRKILTCFVMGKSFDEFPIVIADEIFIDNSSVPIGVFNVGLLKKHIWKEISSKFDGEPNDLILWKAEIPISEENDKVLKNPDVECIIQAFDPKKLRSGDMFLDNEVFPEDYKPPNRHIHILVQPPPSATTEQRPTKRLKLGTEVRGKGDPSFNDLLEVVAHLKRESTNWEELKFIEHPTGKDLPVVQQPKLYIRQDYKALYQIINKKNLDPKFLINGTSGIGKSCFLLYLLVRLLCSSDDVTIIFQTTQSEIFYRFKGSELDVGNFEDASYYLYIPDTWYLVDAKPPMPRLKARTVLAVSPVSYKENKDFDEFSKVVVNKYCMSPWIIDELKVCREHIFPSVPEDLMLRLYDKAGGVPRYVIEMPRTLIKQNNDDEDAIINQSLKRIDESILFIRDFNEFLQCFSNNSTYVKISSCIIHRWPDSTYNYDYHSLHWASSYIYDTIMSKLEQYRWDKLLNRIRNDHEPSNARGILFETYVLNIFKRNKNFEIKCLEKTENHDEEQLQISGFEEYTYIRTAEDLSKYNEGNIAIRPTVKNFGAVDLIIMQDKLFQITVSNKHPIKHNEIVKVIQNMPAFKRGNKIRLFFVVPDEVYDGFTYQNYVTARDDKDKDKDIDDKDPDDLMFRQVKKMSSVLKLVEQWALKVDLSDPHPEKQNTTNS